MEYYIYIPDADKVYYHVSIKKAIAICRKKLI